MGRFETRWLAAEKILSALADLSGRWIDLVHSRRPPRGVVLDIDSSVSPTHGEQEMINHADQSRVQPLVLLCPPTQLCDCFPSESSCPQYPRRRVLFPPARPFP